MKANLSFKIYSSHMQIYEVDALLAIIVLQT